jgi:hypothetical protein
VRARSSPAESRYPSHQIPREENDHRFAVHPCQARPGCSLCFCSACLYGSMPLYNQRAASALSLTCPPYPLQLSAPRLSLVQPPCVPVPPRILSRSKQQEPTPASRLLSCQTQSTAICSCPGPSNSLARSLAQSTDDGDPAGVLLPRRAQAGHRLLQAAQRRQGRRPADAGRGGAVPLPARQRGGRRPPARRGEGPAPRRGVRPAPGRARRAAAVRRPRLRRGRRVVGLHRVPRDAGGGGPGAAAGQLRARLPPRLHRPLDRPRPRDLPALPLRPPAARAGLGQPARPGPAHARSVRRTVFQGSF